MIKLKENNKSRANLIGAGLVLDSVAPELKIATVENRIEIPFWEVVLVTGQIVEIWVSGGRENKFVLKPEHVVSSLEIDVPRESTSLYLSIDNSCFWMSKDVQDCRVWVSSGHTQRLITKGHVKKVEKSSPVKLSWARLLELCPRSDFIKLWKLGWKHWQICIIW